MRSQPRFILLIIINLLGSPSKLFSQTNLLMDINLSDDSLVAPSIIFNLNSQAILGCDVYSTQNNSLSFKSSSLIIYNPNDDIIDTITTIAIPSTLKDILAFKIFSIVNPCK